jgi:hypothetical protein
MTVPRQALDRARTESVRESPDLSRAPLFGGSSWGYLTGCGETPPFRREAGATQIDVTESVARVRDRLPPRVVVVVVGRCPE